MPSIPCPLCGEKIRLKTIGGLPDQLFSHPDRFAIVRCLSCGLGFLDPIPSPEILTRHYPAVYYGKNPPFSPDFAAYRWRLDDIRRFVDGRRILDIGCGAGGFVRFLSLCGWDSHGVDNSAYAVALAESINPGRIRQCTLGPELPYPNESFDAATLFEVMEHVPSPRESLAEARRILKSGGFLFFSVPNFASLESLVFGRAWIGLDVPRHIFQFTPGSVSRFLKETSFTPRLVHSVNACRIQAGRDRASYCRESIRYWLRRIGLYTQPRQLPVGDAQAVSLPTQTRTTSVRLLENAVWSLFCGSASLFDAENTIWVAAQKKSSGK